MAKKINYASMFTLRKDGRYQGSYTDSNGQRKYVYDRDPEKLWKKLNAPKEEKAILFREIAEAWQKDTWEKIRDGIDTPFLFFRNFFALGGCLKLEAEVGRVAARTRAAASRTGLCLRSFLRARSLAIRAFLYSVISNVLLYAKDSLFKAYRNSCGNILSARRPVSSLRRAAAETASEKASEYIAKVAKVTKSAEAAAI